MSIPDQIQMILNVEYMRDHGIEVPKDALYSYANFVGSKPEVHTVCQRKLFPTSKPGQ